MSDSNTRRKFVKNSIAATAALGTVGAVGSASAASSGTILIEGDGQSSGNYEFELGFEDNGGMSITTVSGKFVDHDWAYNADGDVLLLGEVASDADIVMEYENTEAWVEENDNNGLDITIT